MIKKCFALILSALVVHPCFASGDAPASPEPKDTAPFITGITLAPSAWALGVSGSVSLNGMNIPIDMPFNEVIRGVKSGMLGYLQLKTRNGFIYADGVGLKFAQDGFTSFFGQTVKVDLAMAELGYGWNLTQDSFAALPRTLHISPYVGLRKTNLKVRVDGPAIYQSKREDWLDPVVGLIVEGPISDRFSYAIKADAGGFRVDGNDYRSLIALLRYQLNPTTRLAVGYRKSTFEPSNTATDQVGIDFDVKGYLLGLELDY